MNKKFLLSVFVSFCVSSLQALVDPLNVCSLVEQCNARNVKSVDFLFTDINGLLKSVTLPLTYAADACAQGIKFDGSSVAGCTDIFESDMHLSPDLNSFRIVDINGSVVARIMCDVCLSEDTAYQADPRSLLKQQLERAHERGLEFFVGPELEFFLFKEDIDSRALQPIDNACYCSAQSTAAQKQLVSELLDTLRRNHVDAEKLHHEVAQGQYEVSIHYADALTIADQLVLAKQVIKEFAQAHGMRATFMPKPITGINGSGMHVHFSIFDTVASKNLFFDANDSVSISDFGKRFMTGILNHMLGMCALTNPTINSYKRLVAGFEAPVYVCWSRSNRSALIRVPQIDMYQTRAARAELRSSDAMANPYVLFTLLLAAGLDGVDRNVEVPCSVDHNVYKMSAAELMNKGVTILHQNFDRALECLDSDEFVKTVLGERFIAEFMNVKRKEIMNYNRSVSTWELDNYL